MEGGEGAGALSGKITFITCKNSAIHYFNYTIKMKKKQTEKEDKHNYLGVCGVFSPLY